ncbi:MAG: helix-turn-helix domain-containing protein [Dehalococcoidia bacterium]
MPLAQEALSERRRRILDGIVAGKTNPVLADELGLTLDGVKWHVSEMLGELGLSSRQELPGWWRSERAKERVPVGIATASFAKRALVMSARIAIIGGITAAIVVGIYLAATHGSAGTPAAHRSPPQLAYVTVEAPSGDLSSVVSRLYTVEPGKLPSLVRQYPGHLMYEMIASPDGRYIAVTDGNIGDP